MKPLLTCIILLLAVQTFWSQSAEQHHFGCTASRLDQILPEIERLFEVKYSYVDSIAAPKTITLLPDSYTLERLNDEIAQQTALVVVKIDGRYYSIHNPLHESIKIEQLQEILVEGFLSKGINKVGQQVIISPRSVDALPGVTDADILLSLQQLPGVKSPNETASGLHVRGGTSDQNLILWDGIRMYHPGHLFGMISGFNPNVDQTVHYYNKATNPKFGERISSVIDIKTTDKITDDLKVNAGVNLLNADLYVKVPLVKNKLGLQLSGRKSFTEWWQSPTFDALADKVFQNTNFTDFDDRNHFQFADYSAKLNYMQGDNTDISLTGILIDNRLNFNTATAVSDTKSQNMDIRNSGYSVNWNQKYSTKFQQKLLLYYSAYNFEYEKRQFYANGESQRFEKLNRITDSGAELNFNYTATDKLCLEFGYQLLGNDISHSFTGGTQNIKIDLDQKRLYNVTHVGYAHAKYVLEQWNFQAGARFNHFGRLQSESFEPRIFVQKKLAYALVWQLSYERKSQILSQVQESQANDLSLENYVWVLSDNAVYPIQKANQFTTGLIYKTGSWLFDVDAYYKTIDGITSLSFGFMPQFDSALHNGEGFTKGVDILVQKSATNWRAWITYTYQDSQSRYDGINDSRYFSINSENKHALNISFHRKWKNFSAAVGWFWHTGKPYSLLDSNSQRVSFNTGRLPVYHRLDISATYAFHQQKSWSGKLGFSVFNAYNRHSVISKEYERVYTNVNNFFNSIYTVQDYYSLGITPNIFIRISI
jgi:TonB-dependent receptor-like protein